MPAPLRRKAGRRSTPKRRPLNLDSLQMMVQSGVVRRADSSPPEVRLTQFHVVENVDPNLTNDVAIEQGWLSRIVLGRRSHSLFPKRSGIR